MSRLYEEKFLELAHHYIEHNRHDLVIFSRNLADVLDSVYKAGVQGVPTDLITPQLLLTIGEDENERYINTTS